MDTSVPLVTMAPLPIGDPPVAQASHQSDQFSWAGYAAERMSRLRLCMYAYPQRMATEASRRRRSTILRLVGGELGTSFSIYIVNFPSFRGTSRWISSRGGSFRTWLVILNTEL